MTADLRYLALCLGLTACGSQTSSLKPPAPDAGQADGGSAADAGHDAGTVADAGLGTDAGLDAGPAGGQTPDAGMNDGGPDAGPSFDAGSADAGAFDAGASPDAGSCLPVPLDLDTPLDTSLPPFPAVSGQQSPSALWSSTAAPLPTNTAWENLVLDDGTSRVDFLPYQIMAQSNGLAIASQAATPTSTVMEVPTVTQWTLGATELGDTTPHTVARSDLLSVTLQYAAPNGTFTAPLVFGMPYVSADYAGLTPAVGSGMSALVGLDGPAPAGQVSGTRFLLMLADGTTWLLYASAPLTFAASSAGLTATGPYTGTLRLAYAPLPLWASEAALDSHAAAVPRSGEVTVAVACDLATLTFTYATTGSGPLLLGALPHHLARLVAPTVTGLVYPTLTGTLTAVEGASWTQQLPLSTIGFPAPRAIAPADVGAVSAALSGVGGDVGFIPDPATVSGDPYFGGKALAKLARLALIADALGDATDAATLRARLTPLSAAWLQGTNSDRLLYDTTWGGVITTNGLANSSADFGEGHYNDHHFHWGYHLYAAAALAEADPSFFQANQTALLALLRDIANPSPNDPVFPRFRYTDFFRSHSWAGGLEDHPDGQDQESTSEAVNAWYAIQLLGEATGNARLRDLGRVLLALELDGAHTYWQIPATSTIYPPAFARNYGVGILFETQATFSTWFGPNPEYVYGIQMLPYTPVSELLISPEWIASAWGPAMQPLAVNPEVAPGWAGFLDMAYATVDAGGAWNLVNALSGWDDGNSNTNTLWWVATRP